MTHIDNTARVAVEGAWSGGYVKNTSTVLFGECANDYGDVFHHLRPVPVAAQLELLPPGIIYLGSPYSLYAGGYDEAAEAAGYAAAELMRRGHVVFAPIAHGHAISSNVTLPADWPFWKRQCEPFIDAASSMVVLKLDGWRDSVGLTYEIARFHEAGKPIVYVTMKELANG